MYAKPPLFYPQFPCPFHPLGNPQDEKQTFQGLSPHFRSGGYPPSKKWVCVHVCPKYIASFHTHTVLTDVHINIQRNVTVEVEVLSTFFHVQCMIGSWSLLYVCSHPGQAQKIRRDLYSIAQQWLWCKEQLRERKEEWEEKGEGGRQHHTVVYTGRVCALLSVFTSIQTQKLVC